jgi:microcystin-dependent protein
MSQGSTVLPTTGVFSGLTEQGNINAALAALLSNNSGGSAPAAPTQYQFWADTSVSNQVTIRMYVGTTWTPLWTVDTGDNDLSFNANAPVNWVAASGTHDTITATYDPPVPALVDGLLLSFRATAANLTATPSFSPNGLQPYFITKNGGQQLAIGDIPGGLAEVSLRFNNANSRWELINPPAVPVGGIVPYFGGTVPAGYALPQGQNLSATTFPAANAVLGTTYGNPGGGNFAMPDLRGRFFFNLDAGGSGRITSAGGNFDGTVLGNTGGAQSRVIAQNQLPNVVPTISGDGSNVTLNIGATAFLGAGGSYGNVTGSPGNPTQEASATVPVNTIAAHLSVSSINGNVTQQQLAGIPPAMGINCMMRIA